MATKLRVFSGIQPSGQLHIGNYLGAIKQWVPLQSAHDCLFCVVDYHAITVKYDPQTMRDRIFDAALDYLAAGLDPKKATLFVQSHVPEHTELAWLLGTIVPFGELERMTQWKDKVGYDQKNLNDIVNRVIQKADSIINYRPAYILANGKGEEVLHKEILNLRHQFRSTERYKHMLLAAAMELEESRIRGVRAGLLNYPVLMAADILLYHTNIVPVGEDQQQHVELARVIARKFNHAFGQTFIEPKSQLTEAKRIMSLADPSKKMSKSLGSKHYIALTDSPEEIREKVGRAVTDTGAEPGAMSPGVQNLLLLLKEFGTTEELTRFESAHRDKTIRYSELKITLAEAIIRTLKPFQAKRAEMAKKPKQVWKILDDGAKRARPIAQQTLRGVKKKMGLL